jgi:tellurite resistance protein TehA-like permease
MGLVAISALVGATLIEHTARSLGMSPRSRFVKGFTLFFWAIATWWMPMPLVFGIWRYLIRGVPIAYDPLYWGGVFPLGMYSVSIYHLAKILAASFLLPLSQLFMVMAVLPWAATFSGLVDSRLNRLSRARNRPTKRLARISRGSPPKGSQKPRADQGLSRQLV